MRTIKVLAWVAPNGTSVELENVTVATALATLLVDFTQAEFDEILIALASKHKVTAVPQDLLDRITSALTRHVNKEAAMRIPASLNDSDLVLADLESWRNGETMHFKNNWNKGRSR